MRIDKDILEKENEPRCALILYDNHYMESHRIIKGKLQEGKPFSINAIKKLKKTLSNINEDTSISIKGFIPQNLLYINCEAGKEILIWNTYSKKRMLYFKDQVEGEADVPSLIWCYKDNSLHLFAVKQFDREILKTVLFQSPFPNMVNDSSVCLGNISLKEEYEDINDIMLSFENYFFNSYFTSSNEKVLTYWVNAFKEKKDFDYDTLIPHQTKTLKDFIDGIK